MLTYEKLVTAYETLSSDHHRAFYDAELIDAQEATSDSSQTHETQRRNEQQSHQRRARMSKAQSEETWAAREEAALAKIEIAKNKLESVGADFEACKYAQKQERQAQRSKLWGNILTGRFISSGKNTGTNTATESSATPTGAAAATTKQDSINLLNRKRILLTYAQTELERCRQHLWAMRRQRELAMERTKVRNAMSEGERMMRKAAAEEEEKAKKLAMEEEKARRAEWERMERARFGCQGWVEEEV